MTFSEAPFPQPASRPSPCRLDVRAAIGGAWNGVVIGMHPVDDTRAVDAGATPPEALPVPSWRLVAESSCTIRRHLASMAGGIVGHAGFEKFLSSSPRRSI